MTNIQKSIILKKCDEREQMGFDHLNDSDIMDIIEECDRQGAHISRREIEAIFQE